MSREPGLYSEVNRCARCGKNHRQLKFHKFKRPIVDVDPSGEYDDVVWEYWSICPRSQDPILLRTIPKESIEGTSK